MRISSAKQKEIIDRYKVVCNKLHIKSRTAFNNGDSKLGQFLAEKYQLAYYHYKLQLTIVNG